MKRIATTMKMMFKLFHTQKPKLSGDILCTVVLLCWHYFILSFLHNTCLENYAIVYTKATNLEQNNSLLMVLSDSKKNIQVDRNLIILKDWNQRFNLENFEYQKK